MQSSDNELYRPSSLILGGGIHSVTKKAGKCAITCLQAAVGEPAVTRRLSLTTVDNHSQQVPHNLPREHLFFERIAGRSVHSESRLYTSLSELKTALEVSLNGEMANIVRIEADFNKVHQETGNDLFLFIKLKCTEYTEILSGAYKLNTPAAHLFHRGPLADFVQEYGDSYINKIIYGRWAIFIIQFHAQTTSDQRKIAAKLQAGINKVLVGGEVSSTFLSIFEKKHYTIHRSTGGMDDPSAGIFGDVKCITEFAERINSDNQKADPIQVDWKVVTYDNVIKAPMIAPQVQLLKDRVPLVKQWNQAIDFCISATKLCLIALYAENVDSTRQTDLWFTKCHLIRRTILLYRVRALLDVATLLKKRFGTKCYNENVFSDFVTDIKELCKQVKELADTIPRELLVPVINIPSQFIQNITHEGGQFEFDIIPPTDGKYLVPLLVTNERRQQFAECHIFQCLLISQYELNKIATIAGQLNYAGTLAKLSSARYLMKYLRHHCDEAESFILEIGRINATMLACVRRVRLYEAFFSELLELFLEGSPLALQRLNADNFQEYRAFLPLNFEHNLKIYYTGKEVLCSDGGSAVAWVVDGNDAICSLIKETTYCGQSQTLGIVARPGDFIVHKALAFEFDAGIYRSSDLKTAPRSPCNHIPKCVSTRSKSLILKQHIYNGRMRANKLFKINDSNPIPFGNSLLNVYLKPTDNKKERMEGDYTVAIYSGCFPKRTFNDILSSWNGL